MIVVIVGPTGIGKTKLSIELAKRYNADVVNADAVQIYSEPCIASAKIKPSEMEGVTHHLLGVKSLKEDSTIYTFQKEGRKVIDELISKNKNIIIVGGSGLYLKALLYDYKLESEVHKDDQYENLTNDELKKIADGIYSENDIHVNNRKRLIRFINHYNNTGNIIKTKDEVNKKVYSFILIGLTLDREKLYERLDDRVDVMLSEGLVSEAEELYKKGYPKLDTIIGYRELIPYFEDKISLDKAVEEIKKDTRKYSKRQYTWYNNQMKDIHWVNVNIDNFKETIDKVILYIEKNKHSC